MSSSIEHGSRTGLRRREEMKGSEDKLYTELVTVLIIDGEM